MLLKMGAKVGKFNPWNGGDCIDIDSVSPNTTAAKMD